MCYFHIHRELFSGKFSPLNLEIVVSEILICLMLMCVKDTAVVPAPAAATPTSAGNIFIIVVIFSVDLFFVNFMYYILILSLEYNSGEAVRLQA